MTYIVCKTMNVPKKPNTAGLNQMMNIAIKAIVAANLANPCSSNALGDFSALARQAKQFVVAALRSAKVIELRNLRRGKYFRIVADVYVDGQSLAPMLIAKGLGVPYHGGRKTRPWC